MRQQGWNGRDRDSEERREKRRGEGRTGKERRVRKEERGERREGRGERREERGERREERRVVPDDRGDDCKHDLHHATARGQNLPNPQPLNTQTRTFSSKSKRFAPFDKLSGRVATQAVTLPEDSASHLTQPDPLHA
jgi:hypothetical protein